MLITLVVVHVCNNGVFHLVPCPSTVLLLYFALQ